VMISKMSNDVLELVIDRFAARKAEMMTF